MKGNLKSMKAMQRDKATQEGLDDVFNLQSNALKQKLLYGHYAFGELPFSSLNEIQIHENELATATTFNISFQHLLDNDLYLENVYYEKQVSDLGSEYFAITDVDNVDELGSRDKAALLRADADMVLGVSATDASLFSMSPKKATWSLPHYGNIIDDARTYSFAEMYDKRRLLKLDENTIYVQRPISTTDREFVKLVELVNLTGVHSTLFLPEFTSDIHIVDLCENEFKGRLMVPDDDHSMRETINEAVYFIATDNGLFAYNPSWNQQMKPMVFTNTEGLTDYKFVGFYPIAEEPTLMIVCKQGQNITRIFYASISQYPLLFDGNTIRELVGAHLDNIAEAINEDIHRLIPYGDETIALMKNGGFLQFSGFMYGFPPHVETFTVNETKTKVTKPIQHEGEEPQEIDIQPLQYRVNAKLDMPYMPATSTYRFSVDKAELTDMTSSVNSQLNISNNGLYWYFDDNNKLQVKKLAIVTHEEGEEEEDLSWDFTDAHQDQLAIGNILTVSEKLALILVNNGKTMFGFIRKQDPYRFANEDEDWGWGIISDNGGTTKVPLRSMFSQYVCSFSNLCEGLLDDWFEVTASNAEAKVAASTPYANFRSGLDALQVSDVSMPLLYGVTSNAQSNWTFGNKVFTADKYNKVKKLRDSLVEDNNPIENIIAGLNPGADCYSLKTQKAPVAETMTEQFLAKVNDTIGRSLFFDLVHLDPANMPQVTASQVDFDPVLATSPQMTDLVNTARKQARILFNSVQRASAKQSVTKISRAAWSSLVGESTLQSSLFNDYEKYAQDLFDYKIGKSSTAPTAPAKVVVKEAEDENPTLNDDTPNSPIFKTYTGLVLCDKSNSGMTIGTKFTIGTSPQIDFGNVEFTSCSWSTDGSKVSFKSSASKTITENVEVRKDGSQQTQTMSAKMDYDIDLSLELQPGTNVNNPLQGSKVSSATCKVESSKHSNTYVYGIKISPPNFSTSKDYEVGDKVLYSSNTYECTTNHPAGAWDSSYFTAYANAIEYFSFQCELDDIAHDDCKKLAFSLCVNYMEQSMDSVNINKVDCVKLGKTETSATDYTNAFTDWYNAGQADPSEYEFPETSSTYTSTNTPDVNLGGETSVTMQQASNSATLTLQMTQDKLTHIIAADKGKLYRALDNLTEYHLRTKVLGQTGITQPTYWNSDSNKSTWPAAMVTANSIKGLKNLFNSHANEMSYSNVSYAMTKATQSVDEDSYEMEGTLTLKLVDNPGIYGKKVEDDSTKWRMGSTPDMLLNGHDDPDEWRYWIKPDINTTIINISFGLSFKGKIVQEDGKYKYAIDTSSIPVTMNVTNVSNSSSDKDKIGVNKAWVSSRLDPNATNSYKVRNYVRKLCGFSVGSGDEGFDWIDWLFPKAEHDTLMPDTLKYSVPVPVPGKPNTYTQYNGVKDYVSIGKLKRQCGISDGNYRYRYINASLDSIKTEWTRIGQSANDRFVVHSVDCTPKGSISIMGDMDIYNTFSGTLSNLAEAYKFTNPYPPASKNASTVSYTSEVMAVNNILEQIQTLAPMCFLPSDMSVHSHAKFKDSAHPSAKAPTIHTVWSNVYPALKSHLNKAMGAALRLSEQTDNGHVFEEADTLLDSMMRPSILATGHEVHDQIMVHALDKVNAVHTKNFVEFDFVENQVPSRLYCINGNTVEPMFFGVVDRKAMFFKESALTAEIYQKRIGDEIEAFAPEPSEVKVLPFDLNDWTVANTSASDIVYWMTAEENNVYDLRPGVKYPYIDSNGFKGFFDFVDFPNRQFNITNLVYSPVLSRVFATIEGSNDIYAFNASGLKLEHDLVYQLNRSVNCTTFKTRYSGTTAKHITSLFLSDRNEDAFSSDGFNGKCNLVVQFNDNSIHRFTFTGQMESDVYSTVALSNVFSDINLTAAYRQFCNVVINDIQQTDDGLVLFRDNLFYRFVDGYAQLDDSILHDSFLKAITTADPVYTSYYLDNHLVLNCLNTSDSMSELYPYTQIDLCSLIPELKEELEKGDLLVYDIDMTSWSTTSALSYIVIYTNKGVYLIDMGLTPNKLRYDDKQAIMDYFTKRAKEGLGAHLTSKHHDKAILSRFNNWRRRIADNEVYDFAALTTNTQYTSPTEQHGGYNDNANVSVIVDKQVFGLSSLICEGDKNPGVVFAAVNTPITKYDTTWEKIQIASPLVDTQFYDYFYKRETAPNGAQLLTNILNLNHLPFIYRQNSDHTWDMWVNIPSTMTPYMNRIVGSTMNIKGGRTKVEGNVAKMRPNLNNIGTIADPTEQATTVRLYINTEHFHIDTIKEAVISGCSMPMHVYRDPDANDGLFDGVQLQSVWNRQIETVMDKHGISHAMLEFKVWGADEQCVHLRGETAKQQ